MSSKDTHESRGEVFQGPNRKKTSIGPKKHSQNSISSPKWRTFADLAIDLLSEICGHGPPLSVLNLARTNKSMRAFLMSKNSKAAWIAARMRIGVPGPNPGVSEPQYASFLFEDGCQAPQCVVAKCQRDYIWTLRYCDQCTRARKMSWNDVEKVWPSQLPRTVMMYVPLDKECLKLDDALPVVWATTYQAFIVRLLEIAGQPEENYEALYEELDTDVVQQHMHGNVIFEWRRGYIRKRELKQERYHAGREKEMIAKLEKVRKEFTKEVIDDFKRSDAGKSQWQACIRGNPCYPVEWRVDEDLPHKKLSDREWYAMRDPLELAVVRYRDSKNSTPRSGVKRRPWTLDLEDATEAPVRSRTEPKSASRKR